MKLSSRWPIAARVGSSVKDRSTSSSRCASMKPVSTAPSMKSGWLAHLARKAALVLTGHTSTRPQASARRWAASSRSTPWAISLAIIGS
jgi:hypothetical protein